MIYHVTQIMRRQTRLWLYVGTGIVLLVYQFSNCKYLVLKTSLLFNSTSPFVEDPQYLNNSHLTIPLNLYQKQLLAAAMRYAT